MIKVRAVLSKWGPAAVWMAMIFASSATPNVDLPHFGLWDYAVKKGGHFLAYALLSLTYLRGMGWRTQDRRGLASAWLLAVAYALLDEWHQSFVPGRHPSWVDALLFDAGGALTALMLAGLVRHHGPKPVD